MMNDKIYGPIGMDSIKINMKEPFKLEKKIRREADVIQSKEQNTSSNNPAAGLAKKDEDTAVVMAKKPTKEKKTSKKTSKKAIKEAKESEDAE